MNNSKNRIEIRGFAAEEKCDKLEWHKKPNGAPWRMYGELVSQLYISRQQIAQKHT